MGFAVGKWADSLCQRCGFRFKYREISMEPGTKLRVCPDCNDGRWSLVDHPQNHPPKKLIDNIGLKNPVPKKTLITDEYLMAEEQPKGTIVDYISLFLLTP